MTQVKEDSDGERRNAAPLRRAADGDRRAPAAQDSSGAAEYLLERRALLDRSLQPLDGSAPASNTRRTPDPVALLVLESPTLRERFVKLLNTANIEVDQPATTSEALESLERGARGDVHGSGRSHSQCAPARYGIGDAHRVRRSARRHGHGGSASLRGENDCMTVRRAVSSSGRICRRPAASWTSRPRCNSRSRTIAFFRRSTSSPAAAAGASSSISFRARAERAARLAAPQPGAVRHRSLQVHQ